MAAVVVAFLIWSFATGKFSDWANLIGVNTGGATGSWGVDDNDSEPVETQTQKTSSKSDGMNEMINAFGAFAGTMDGGTSADTTTSMGIWT